MSARAEWTVFETGKTLVDDDGEWSVIEIVGEETADHYEVVATLLSAKTAVDQAETRKDAALMAASRELADALEGLLASLADERVHIEADPLRANLLARRRSDAQAVLRKAGRLS